MKQTWTEAGGQYQFPFMGAASQFLRGAYTITCPKCAQDTLRFYFHIFNKDDGTGTIWVWCSTCKMTSHLPRVRAKIDDLRDPFKEFKPGEFIQLELDATEPLLDKLDRLWSEGVISYPNRD